MHTYIHTHTYCHTHACAHAHTHTHTECYMTDDIKHTGEPLGGNTGFTSHLPLPAYSCLSCDVPILNTLRRTSEKHKSWAVSKILHLATSRAGGHRGAGRAKTGKKIVCLSTGKVTVCGNLSSLVFKIRVSGQISPQLGSTEEDHEASACCPVCSLHFPDAIEVLLGWATGHFQ